MSDKSKEVSKAAIFGSGLQALIFVFLLYTTIQMYITPPSPAATMDGDIDPEALKMAYIYSNIMFTGMTGVFGLIINFFTAAVSGYRARWFFRVSLIFSFIYLAVFPAGTFFGSVFIIYLLIKRNEFLQIN